VLEPDKAQAVAVVMHELATNAAKCGALSVPDGRVDVSWSREADGRLAISWVETGGPPAARPSAGVLDRASSRALSAAR
jgi:two-component sensor histidine kinase